MKMMTNWKKLILTVAVVTPILLLGAMEIMSYKIKHFKVDAAVVEGLPTYSEADLKAYDGTDANKPIYIGLNGYVYDVTPGKEYYVTGGTYHYLAGKDSSAQLNLIGGDIIQRKYKIVGILQK